MSDTDGKAPEAPQGGGVPKLERKTNLAPAAQEMTDNVFLQWTFQQFMMSVAPECANLESVNKADRTEADKLKVLIAIKTQLDSVYDLYPEGPETARNYFLKLQKHIEKVETIDGPRLTPQ